MNEVFEDVAPNGNQLFVHKGKRCVKCGAMLIIEIDDGMPRMNLKRIGDHYECKDSVECESNVFAENTRVEIVEDVDATGKGRIKAVVTSFGKEVFSMEANKDGRRAEEDTR